MSEKNCLYESIEDMPIYNWFKCIEKLEFKYCIQSGVFSDEECKEKFQFLYDEFIDKYGINDNLLEILRLQNKILINKIEIKLDGDRSRETFIEIFEIELAKLLEVKETKTNTSKIAIEKYLGFPLNMKVTTVTDYYDYLEVIKQEYGRTTD